MFDDQERTEVICNCFDGREVRLIPGRGVVRSGTAAVPPPPFFCFSLEKRCQLLLAVHGRLKWFCCVCLVLEYACSVKRKGEPPPN